MSCESRANSFAGLVICSMYCTLCELICVSIFTRKYEINGWVNSFRKTENIPTADFMFYFPIILRNKFTATHKLLYSMLVHLYTSASLQVALKTIGLLMF